jgi:hypothetical protein
MMLQTERLYLHAWAGDECRAEGEWLAGRPGLAERGAAELRLKQERLVAQDGGVPHRVFDAR